MTRWLRWLLPLAVLSMVLGGFLLTTGLLLWRSQDAPEAAEVTVASTGNVEVKTVATGSIVPRNEVGVKSRVSGVVGEIRVEPGHLVAPGDTIATIEVLPDAARLASAQARVRTTAIAKEDAQRQLSRAETLADQGAVSASELERAQTAFALARQEHGAAVADLQIVKDGAARSSGDVSTDVRSPVGGMVLGVDVKVGYSVIESNTFNEGTTIAYVANMNDLVFEGFLDESEVGRVKEGMALTLTVGALDDARLDGRLEYISPKGIETDGAVQFEIRAAIEPPKDVFVRAGSSANASIVLGRAEEVVVVDERALRFDGDRVYVLAENGEERTVQVGLSDGLRIQITRSPTGSVTATASSCPTDLRATA